MANTFDTFLNWRMIWASLAHVQELCIVGFHHLTLSALASSPCRRAVVVRARMEAIMLGFTRSRMSVLVAFCVAASLLLAGGCVDRQAIQQEQERIAIAQQESDKLATAIARYEAELATNAERAARIGERRQALRQQIRDLSTQLAIASDATFDTLNATLTAAREQLAKIDEQDRSVQAVVAAAKSAITQNQSAAEAMDRSIERSRQAISDIQERGVVGLETAGQFAGDALTVAEAAGVPWAGTAKTLIVGAISGISFWLFGKKTGRQEGAATVVNAVDAAKINGVVNFADPTQRALLDANLGAAGKALVDAAQGK